MGLLDRFRAQPRWKHSNPAVRIAAVEELPLDQQDTLAALARDDRDAGVRIAALKKILSPSVIADVARGDADGRVKDEATTLLVDLAVGAFEGTDQAESLAALAGLADTKHVLAVARGAANETVARAALARLGDAASLGSVARRSPLPAIRLEALARLADEPEILTVALRAEFKDVATAAVERLQAKAHLEDAAGRARNKSAAKRARARVREIELAEAAAAAPARPVPVPEDVEAAARQRRAADLCRRLEGLAATGLDEGEAALAEIERTWQGLGVPDGDEVAARYRAARDAAQVALAADLADRVERARVAHVVADAVSARRALCEKLDTLAGDETPASLDELKAAFAALQPCPDEVESSRWARRFEDGLRAAEARHRALLAQRGLREKAGQACEALERLAESAVFPKARGDFQALRRAWNELAAQGFDDAALGARVREAEARLQAREAESRELQAQQQRENLARLEKMCAELEELQASPSLALKQGENALRVARAALDETGPLPGREDHERIAGRLKNVLSALFPRVQELRDLDEWQRWANAGVQEDLCKRVEALVQVDDLALAAKQLREAQAQWKQVATAPREQSQALWTRFRAASDAVRARCDVYFAQLAGEQASNQARKESLCEQAEALAGSNDWIKTADAIKALQAEWKQVGPAPRAREKALWERFHAACDGFFTRRREDLQHRKEEWNANLARKEDLCAQAEAIAETTEWQKGIEAIKRLQAEWKTVGPVRKTRTEAVWQRFRAACDRFFERYQHRESLAASASLADAEAVVQELERLVPAQGEVPPAPEGLRETTQALRERWLGLVAALPRDRALRLGERYTAAVTALVGAWPQGFAGTEWDPEVNVRRMEELCVQVEQLLPAEAAPAEAAAAVDESPSTLLARQLREALATNTIAGRQDDTARWKAAAEQVRAAQAAWRRIGPVGEEVARVLNARFQRACGRVAEKTDPRKRH